MGPYKVIKVLSNNIYTKRKIGTRYTQTLHRIRIDPYVPEQRLPDVTVRAIEYVPGPHNEWYAASWEKDFGKQMDEHETSEIANNNQESVTQKILDTNDKKTVQKETENQSEDTNDVTPSSPDFSNLTTDVVDNSYIRRPHPLKVHLFPQNLRPQLSDIIKKNKTRTSKVGAITKAQKAQNIFFEKT